MKVLSSFLLLIFLFTISCGKSKNVQQQKDLVNDSIKKVTTIKIGVKEVLNEEAQKALANWKPYHKLDDFILQFYSISPSDALSNSAELSQLVSRLKDSITPEKLNTLSVIARINVLQNETLRLADMTTIPTITDKDVADEVKKIIDLYTSLNSKINTIYQAEALQNKLEVDTEKPVEIKVDKKPEYKPVLRNNRKIQKPEIK